MDAFLNTALTNIDHSWKEVLREEFAAPYFRELQNFLKKEHYEGREIFPPSDRWFAAFNLTPFDKVKVVIIGQDPYHGIGQANGLCFSVASGVRIPPSLANIFKELQSDLGIPLPSDGSLESWARQGVLLLNATLTVRCGEAGSHQKRGWEKFTDAVIRKLNDNREGIIFLLWGNFAKEKAGMIDSTRHHILTAAHPSPLARNAFSGCRHFSRTNNLLTAMHKTPVDWHLQ
jgi:uracil-DNA glycosylase